MESEFIKSLQNKLKQAGLSRIEKPKEAKGLGADKKNEKRQDDYYWRMVDAKISRFNNRLNILASAIPETPEQYVELFQFMEMYHGNLTDSNDRVEKEPTALDAIGDNYFLWHTRNGYTLDNRVMGDTPQSVYEEYIKRFPIYQMKHRHYVNAATRFPEDATLAAICAEHNAQYNQLKEDIAKRFEAVKEENIARLKREEEEKARTSEAKKQAKIAEREELQNMTFKVFLLKHWKLIAGVIIAFFVLRWIWFEFFD